MFHLSRRFRRRVTTGARAIGRGIIGLREPLALGIVALALSVALWLVVNIEQNPPETGTVTTGVALQSAPTGVVPFGNPEQTVQVTAVAPRDVWARVTPNTFRATANLAEADPGRQTIPVKVDATNPLVQVVAVDPPRIPVNLEPVERKTVPVDVELSGNLPFGFVNTDPRPEPAQAVVSGPAPVVQQVERVVAMAKLDGARVTINRQVEELVPVNNEGAPIRSDALTIEPKSVAITVPIDQQIAYRTVPVNAQITGTIPTGYWLAGINVSPPAVTITGLPSAIEPVNFLETEPIDVSGLVTSTVRQASLVAPEGVGLVANQRVNVTVDVNQLQGSQSFPVAVQPTNLEAGLTANTTPVRVTLAGPVPRLRDLLSSQIRVTADLSGLGPGEHTRDVTVEAPPGFQLVNVTPEWTRVFIQQQ